MKILLTGADGQVGYELWRTLQHIGEVIPTTRLGKEVEGMPTIAMDLCNTEDIENKINTIQPDLICNAAAYTAVDNAESDKETAYKINAVAPEIFAKYAVITDTRVVHFSTDYVFSGQNKQPWKEDDECNPLGVYGETKLQGEQAIIDSGCQFMIFRTAWVFSYRGHNFVHSMINLAKQRDVLHIVDDQIGSPTSAESIATAVAMALLNPVDGIYHITSSGKTSWHRFARRIIADAFELGLLDQQPSINAIPSSQYPTPAQRPSYSVLDCNKLFETFNIKMPNWQTSLQLCMQKIRRES
ncbi:MAG: dTDP-4-dehydrorhamnose reductase [Gammaproteobacteria bacterium]|jgi:dTDP-4-dehydrorhamnose reductase|nr:dTDP-4-dehydrorhamnose reductase [Xanthomonadales bacterium]